MKIHKDVTNYITTGDEEEVQQSTERISVFDRLGTSTSHVSVFDRIGKQHDDKAASKRIPAQERLGALKVRKTKAKKEASIPKDHKEIKSKFPSQMIRQRKWVVKTGEMLKAKQHTVIITSSSQEQKEEEIHIASSFHVTIVEDDQEEVVEENAEEAPLAFEEGNKATVDDLKEINLGTLENPRPIFLSANLSQE